MILVTGSTGFIGKTLVRKLVESGQEVRLLLRPSPQSPRSADGVIGRSGCEQLDRRA